jgi:hypothetical protein
MKIGTLIPLHGVQELHLNVLLQKRTSVKFVHSRDAAVFVLSEGKHLVWCNKIPIS